MNPRSFSTTTPFIFSLLTPLPGSTILAECCPQQTHTILNFSLPFFGEKVERFGRGLKMFPYLLPSFLFLSFPGLKPGRLPNHSMPPTLYKIKNHNEK